VIEASIFRDTQYKTREHNADSKHEFSGPTILRFKTFRSTIKYENS